MRLMRWNAAIITAAIVVSTGGPAAAQSSSGQAARNPGQNNTTRGGSLSQSDEKKFVEQMLMANLAEIELGRLASERASSPEVKSFAQAMVTDHTQANEDLAPIAQRLGVQQPTELDAKHQRLSERLSKLQAQEFDREYIKAMVDAHQEVAKKSRAVADKTDVSGHGFSSAGSPVGTSGSSGMSGTSGTGGTAGTPASGTGAATAGAATPPTTTTDVNTTTAGQMDPAFAQYLAKTMPFVQHHLEQAQQLEKSVGK